MRHIYAQKKEVELKKSKEGYGYMVYLLVLLLLPGWSTATEKEEIRLTPDLGCIVINTSPLGANLVSNDKIGKRFRVNTLLANPVLTDSFFSSSPTHSINGKKFEISLIGGYITFSGTMKGQDVPSDLNTGMWSPWFGQGYTGFYWGDGPDSMDDVIGEPVVNQEAGAFGGVRLGYNINPRFQIEFMFNYGFKGLKFDDEAWDVISSVPDDTVERLESIGRNPNFTDNSISSIGKTYMYGVNLNINLITEGSFIPYFSIGIGAVTDTESPVISYDCTQYSFGESANYTLDVIYETKTAIAFSAGVGGKIILGKNFGLKLEVRGASAKLSLDQNLETAFSRTAPIWAEYESYDKTAVTQTGNQLMIGGGIGLFFSF